MPHLKTEDKLLRIYSDCEYDEDIPNVTYNSLIKKIDKDKWYYTNKKIHYNLNEYGYRSDKLSDISNNDYILTFGCSYSYGTGLFYEDTYSYKLSKELGLKNINLSTPGSGIKVQQYNTTLFVNNFIQERLPKYVLYQYPHDYRVTLAKHLNEKQLDITTQSAKSTDYSKNYYIDEYYLKNQGEKYLQDLLIPLYLNNIWKALGVPVFHYTFSDYFQEYKSNHQTFDILEIKDCHRGLYSKARDLSHNGRDFHNDVKEIILNKIKNG